MTQIFRKALALGIIVCIACTLRAREWTIDGTVKIEAEFSGSIGNTVFLRKADGSQVKCPLASLSAE
ncbi:MAG: hypothetical protein KGJ37_06300, partial [Verrucomicrobiota bacterium]|nr:hypothetical protein [Verrucomicrobiota bacterium]